MPVRIPRPERMAWHKMLVSELRGATREKRGKDLQQAAVLFAVLAEDAPGALEEAFRDLPRGSRVKVKKAATHVEKILVSNGLERAAEHLRGA